MSRIAAAAGKVAVMAAAHNPHFKNRLRLNIKKSASCGFSLSAISPLSSLGRGIARHADSFPAQRLNLLPVYSIGQLPRRREPPYRLERRRRAMIYIGLDLNENAVTLLRDQRRLVNDLDRHARPQLREERGDGIGVQADAAVVLEMVDTLGRDSSVQTVSGRAQTYPVLAERVVRSRRHFAAYDLALARHFFLYRFRHVPDRILLEHRDERCPAPWASSGGRDPPDALRQAHLCERRTTSAAGDKKRNRRTTTPKQRKNGPLGAVCPARSHRDRRCRCPSPTCPPLRRSARRSSRDSRPAGLHNPMRRP